MDEIFHLLYFLCLNERGKGLKDQLVWSDIVWRDGAEGLTKDEIFHLVSDEEIARSQSASSDDYQYQDPNPKYAHSILNDVIMMYTLLTTHSNAVQV